MAILLAIGVFFVLGGMMYCTERVERYWATRRPKVVMLPRLKPLSSPFRTSDKQCVDCGQDDEPLSIDDGRCFVCFKVAHG